MFNIDNLLRENIKKPTPRTYCTGFRGDAEIFLNANENSLAHPYQNGLIVILIPTKYH